MNDIPPAGVPPAASCPQHPGVSADFVCAQCQTAVCVECCYSLPNGSVCCKNCYAQGAEPARPEPSPEPAVPAAPGGLRISGKGAPAIRVATSTHTAAVRPVVAATIGIPCVQHPHVGAVARCKLCGAGSCHTCDFLFPGNVHLCPVCATTTKSRLSPLRKKYLIAAFCLAGWASLGLLVLMSGLLAGLGEDKVTEVILGLVLVALIAVPAVVGTGLGMSTLRKGGPNPISAWIALVWNALLMAAILLLMVIGNLAG